VRSLSALIGLSTASGSASSIRGMGGGCVESDRPLSSRSLMVSPSESDLSLAAGEIPRHLPRHTWLLSGGWGGFVVMLVSVAASSAITAWLWPLVRPFPTPLFLAAVMISAWTGGAGPGLVATALSTLVLAHLGTRSPDADGPWYVQVAHLVAFVLVATLITGLNTVRRRAQDAAAHSERFLQSTIDSLSVQIALINGQGVIVAANAAWHRFFETGGERMTPGAVGTNYLDVWRSGDGEAASAIEVGMREVLGAEHREFFGEFPQWGRGERRWFAVRLTRFQGGGPKRVVGVHEDLTERRRADEAERREEALRSVARLASAAGHEINNPLAIIMGNVEIIAQQVAGEASDRIRPTLDAVDRIRVIVQRMTRITDLKLYEQSPRLPEMLDLLGSSGDLTEDRELAPPAPQCSGRPGELALPLDPPPGDR
jgi:PAS domain S-box-containing protein